MIDFVALDFETANSNRSSACAVGLAVVHNGQIVNTAYTLLKPVPDHFDPVNEKIHGITALEVAGAPDFESAWAKLRTKIADLTVAAYNASFDMSVLYSALVAHNLPPALPRYSCVLQLARTAWPGLENYKLSTVAQSLGIHFRHHHAMTDAETCALVAVEAAKVLRLRNLPGQQYLPGSNSYDRTSALEGLKQLLERVSFDSRLTLKELDEIDTWIANHQSYRNRWPYSELMQQLENVYEDGFVSAEELDATINLIKSVLQQLKEGNKAPQDLFTCRADGIDFCNKVFVFTGEMEALARHQAESAVCALGGICAKTITKQAHYLVIGQKGSDAWKGHGWGTKIEKAIKLRGQGVEINIISETDFLQALALRGGNV